MPSWGGGGKKKSLSAHLAWVPLSARMRLTAAITIFQTGLNDIRLDMNQENSTIFTRSKVLFAMMLMNASQSDMIAQMNTIAKETKKDKTFYESLGHSSYWLCLNKRLNRSSANFMTVIWCPPYSFQCRFQNRNWFLWTAAFTGLKNQQIPAVHMSLRLPIRLSRTFLVNDTIQDCDF